MIPATDNAYQGAASVATKDEGASVGPRPLVDPFDANRAPIAGRAVREHSRPAHPSQRKVAGEAIGPTMRKRAAKGDA